MSSHKAELERAADHYEIFNLLTDEYASFLNYGIFQDIINKYRIDNGQEQLKYPEHLKTYILKHQCNALEFMKSNSTEKSKALVLKINVELTSELSKIIELKLAIAKILGLKPLALQLCGIKTGSIVVTFLVPHLVAEFIFNEHSGLTKEQIRRFRALQVQLLECNDCKFDFTTKDVDFTVGSTSRYVFCP